MPTSLYTDAGRVAAALAFQSPETLSAGISAGAVSITLYQSAPGDWQLGSTLVLDINNPALRETVTITAAPSDVDISISACVNSHAAGCPVVNVTAVEPYTAQASRWFDSLTYNKLGFAYEAVTEAKEAYIDNDGYLIVPLSKPLVALSDITSVTFQPTPLDPAQTVDLTKAWVENGNVLRAVPVVSSPNRRGMASASYTGGFNPLPDDLVLAVTMLAARLYKERDSGYSDVVGSADTGIMQYKKALPADVNAVVQRYRRWTV